MADDEFELQHLRESKFMHLLKPIRDLADNWSVNIAEELEEYIQHLDRRGALHAPLANASALPLGRQLSANAWATGATAVLNHAPPQPPVDCC